ncbi:MAG: PspC domain-containing protein [Eubacteriales bacterium]|nr:PspC domain-containing protein [Eubacteriales bacterium]
MDLNRKLYRSNTNRMLCGVCGGIGEYLGIDPTLIRLLWALVACSGAGIVVYFLAAIIIPQEPSSSY